MTQEHGMLQSVGLQNQLRLNNSRHHVELLQMQEGDNSKRQGAPRRTLEGHSASQGCQHIPHPCSGLLSAHLVAFQHSCFPDFIKNPFISSIAQVWYLRKADLPSLRDSLNLFQSNSIDSHLPETGSR